MQNALIFFIKIVLPGGFMDALNVRLLILARYVDVKYYEK
jgi:hypothetical protein